MQTIGGSSSSSISTPVDNDVEYALNTVTNSPVHTLSTTVTEAASGQVVEGNVNSVSLDDPDVYSSCDGYEATLADYFSRPVIIGQGNFSSTDTGSTYTSFDPYLSILTKNPYAPHLQGRYLVRGDLNIRLVVNSTKFQMGRYVFKFVPTGGVGGTCRDPWISMHRANIVSVSQLPGLEIELGVDTEATMTIPFKSCYQGLAYPNLAAGSHFGSPGEVFFYPYSAVAAASGPLTASYTLWGSLSNIKLLSLAVPQMASMVREKKQNGLSSITEESSSFTTQALKAALPAIESTVPPWATEVGKLAVKTLGWSRPNDSSPVTRVTERQLAYNANCDVADTSQSLSLSSGNCVATRNNVANSTYDEQTIKYLVSREAIFHDEEWNASRLAGDILTTHLVSPIAYLKPYTDGVTSYAQYAPVGHIGKLFKMWRGSFTFKMRFVKTCFHSGRLSVYFQPSSSVAVTSYAGAQADSVWLSRKIIDLSSVSEVEFTVPFVFDSDWAWVGQSIGKIYVSVLDPLIAPSTVNNYVRVLTSVKAGPDFSYSVPTNRPLQVFVPAVMQMASIDDGRRVDLGILGDKRIAPTVTPDVYCIGESVTSSLQLLKRYTQFYSGPSSPGANPTLTTIRPFHFGVSTYVSGALRATQFTDMYSFFSSMFTFSNGGMRFRFLNTVKGHIVTNLDLEPTLAADILVKTNSGTSLNNTIISSCVSQFFPDTYTAEVTVPQYHKQHTRANAAHMTNFGYIGNSGSLPETSGLKLSINSPVDATVASTAFYSRAVNDDFYLSGFISTVPLLITT